jgi:hypothetical protein
LTSKKEGHVHGRFVRGERWIKEEYHKDVNRITIQELGRKGIEVFILRKVIGVSNNNRGGSND